MSLDSGTSRPFLALDTSSPTVSVAVAAEDRVLAEEFVAQRESSSLLLGMVEDVLGQSGCELSDLAGVCALQGPGSFTGLRIGLATTLAFHQSLALPATAIPTLQVLAAACAGLPSAIPQDGAQVLAVIDARRGECFTQGFRVTRSGPIATTDPEIKSVAALFAPPSCTVVGFDIETLLASAAIPDEQLLSAPPLAGLAALLAASRNCWDASSLTRPLYLRPPPASKRLPPAS